MATLTHSHICGVSQIAFAVENVDRATQFFRDQLGLQLLFSTPHGLACFDLGGLRLMLARPQGSDQTGANSALYLRVENIQEAYNDFLTRQIRFERPPLLVAKTADHELWMAFFRDPENNLLALVEERP